MPGSDDRIRTDPDHRDRRDSLGTPLRNSVSPVTDNHAEETARKTAQPRRYHHPGVRHRQKPLKFDGGMLDVTYARTVSPKCPEPVVFLINADDEVGGKLGREMLGRELVADIADDFRAPALRDDLDPGGRDGEGGRGDPELRLRERGSGARNSPAIRALPPGHRRWRRDELPLPADSQVRADRRQHHPPRAALKPWPRCRGCTRRPFLCPVGARQDSPGQRPGDGAAIRGHARPERAEQGRPAGEPVSPFQGDRPAERGVPRALPSLLPTSYFWSWRNRRHGR